MELDLLVLYGRALGLSGALSPLKDPPDSERAWIITRQSE